MENHLHGGNLIVIQLSSYPVNQLGNVLEKLQIV